MVRRFFAANGPVRLVTSVRASVVVRACVAVVVAAGRSLVVGVVTPQEKKGGKGTQSHRCGGAATHGCTKSSPRIYSAYVTCGCSLSPSGVRGVDTAAACSPFSRLVSLGCAQGCGWASLDRRSQLPA